MPSRPHTAVRLVLAWLLLRTAGCSWLRRAPTPILSAEELYRMGEVAMEKRTYAESRDAFKKIVERHPTSSYAARARFLMGETYYRESEFDKAINEFRIFMSFYPRHQIADLVQYRLAMAYYDQIKPIEQDRGTALKTLGEF